MHLRELMQQLVAKFQRTSATPRNFILLNTPKYAAQASRYIETIAGGPTPSLDVAPDCFEVVTLPTECGLWLIA
jgi:hypothetical protein